MSKEKKNIYVHETITLFSDNGELVMETEENIIVFNAENLFKDLPTIVEMCHKETKNSFTETVKQLNDFRL